MKLYSFRCYYIYLYNSNDQLNSLIYSYVLIHHLLSLSLSLSATLFYR